MSQQIHTKLHQAIELIRDGLVFMRSPPNDGDATPVPLFDQKWCNYEQIDGLLVDLMLSAHHYVLTPEVIKLIDSEAGVSSMVALNECGINHMPFSTVLIEQPLNTPDGSSIRQFCLLVERPKDFSINSGEVLGILSFLHGNLAVELPPIMGTMMALEKVIKDGRADLLSKIELNRGLWITGNPGKKFDDLTVFNNAAADMGRAWMDAILLLHTRGISKEVIAAPHKLNKVRAKSGKPAIPTHTVIRIGKVYDRSGQEVKRTGHSGRHMRVHWRAGHARNQAWGPGLTQHKLIYIEPVLVNYDPVTGEKPKQIPHLVVASGGGEA